MRAREIARTHDKRRGSSALAICDLQDPAKLEACIWFVYTTLPMPPSVLLNATADELKWWLSIPIEVATQLIAAAEAAPDTANLAGLAGLVESACAAAGDSGERVEVEAVLLRFAAEDECEEYLRQVPPCCRCCPPSNAPTVSSSRRVLLCISAESCQATIMIELLLPFRDLNRPIPANATPRCITKERLKLCWEQALVLLLLLFAPVTCELKGPSGSGQSPSRSGMPLARLA